MDTIKFYCKKSLFSTVILVFILVMAIGLCVLTACAASSTYSDTKGHWAEDAIERWSEYGIITGNDGKFEPDQPLTRAQMAAILSNTLHLTEQDGNPFQDVKSSAWYAPYVLRCYAAGILNGDGTNANPEDTLTREQAMTMLCHALEIQTHEQDLNSLARFIDRDQISDWAVSYVAAMVNNGIVSGTGTDELSPTADMSRAAIITVLDQAIIQYINETGTYQMVDADGIILVSAGDVKLTGTTRANLLVTRAANGTELVFEGARVTGSITVQADDLDVINRASAIPTVVFAGSGVVSDDDESDGKNVYRGAIPTTYADEDDEEGEEVWIETEGSDDWDDEDQEEVFVGDWDDEDDGDDLDDEDPDEVFIGDWDDEEGGSNLDDEDPDEIFIGDWDDEEQPDSSAADDEDPDEVFIGDWSDEDEPDPSATDDEDPDEAFIGDWSNEDLADDTASGGSSSPNQVPIRSGKPEP